VSNHAGHDNGDLHANRPEVIELASEAEVDNNALLSIERLSVGHQSTWLAAEAASLGRAS
jgi:hypothetical protein